MCDADQAQPTYTRRSLLASVGVAGLGVLLTPSRGSAADSPFRLVVPARLGAGLVPVKHAMHVHASGSEMTASMHAQLDQAAALGIDTLWWTEHGWRTMMYGYRRFISFSGSPDREDGQALYFVPEPPVGQPAVAGGGIVATPASPLDPAGGALRVRARGATTAPAAQSYLVCNYPDLAHSRLMLPYRGWIGRTRLVLEVTPTALGRGSSLELAITLSSHPTATGLTPHTLTYRFARAAAAPTVDGAAGAVTLPVVLEQRCTVTLDPASDIAALWPQLQSQDMSLLDLRFRAVSVGGARADGLFESLRFDWCTPAQSLQLQGDLMAAYAPQYPGVQQRAGSEISRLSPHVCRFGGDPLVQDAELGATASAYYPGTVAAIRASGGASSWNHPFGSDTASEGTADQQAQRRRQVFAAITGVQAYGVDALEVAYYSRGGAGMRTHLDLWDTFSRNLLLLTGTGANDDHLGGDWGRVKNGYHTVTLSSDTSEAGFVLALRGGRAFFGHSGLAPATVLELDNGAVMGQVDVLAVRERWVTVMAAGLPAGSGVRVVQGLVDYAGLAAPDPAVTTLASFAADSFATGSVTVPFSVPGQGTFLRVEVVDVGGTVLAGSNPVFALYAPPPSDVVIPPERSRG